MRLGKTNTRMLTGVEFDKWNSIYNLISPLTSGWQGSTSVIQSLSPSWQSSTATVQSLSSGWQSSTTVRNLSGNWQNTYTTVQSLSPSWGASLTGSLTSSVLQYSNRGALSGIPGTYVLGTGNNLNFDKTIVVGGHDEVAGVTSFFSQGTGVAAIRGPDYTSSSGPGGILVIEGGRKRGAFAGGDIKFVTTPLDGNTNPAPADRLIITGNGAINALAGTNLTIAGSASVLSQSNVYFNSNSSLTFGGSSFNVRGSGVNITSSSVTLTGSTLRFHTSGGIVLNTGVTLTTNGNASVNINTGGAININSGSSFTINSGSNIIISAGITCNLAQFGEATTDTLGFWGVSPVTQPTASAGTSIPAGVGSNPMNYDDTFDGAIGTAGYTVNDIVYALKSCGIIASN